MLNKPVPEISTPSSVFKSPEHVRAVLKWFDTMRQKDEWNLTIDEQIELLGGVKKRTFQEWKKKAIQGKPVELSRDTMERLSLLLGIYKALKIIAPDARMDVAKKWFNQPNTNILFSGKSPKEFLLSVGTMESLYKVRRYLDSARG